MVGFTKRIIKSWRGVGLKQKYLRITLKGKHPFNPCGEIIGKIIGYNLLLSIFVDGEAHQQYFALINEDLLYSADSRFGAMLLEIKSIKEISFQEVMAMLI